MLEAFLLKPCPKCGARVNELCVQNGKTWHEAVHRVRTYDPPEGMRITLAEEMTNLMKVADKAQHLSDECFQGETNDNDRR